MAEFLTRSECFARSFVQQRSGMLRILGFYLGALLLATSNPMACGQAVAQGGHPLFLTFPDSFEWEQEQWPTPSREISCRVRNFPPFLGFEFRFLTGYTAEIPLREIRGPANRFLLRVGVSPLWPEAAEEVYFSRRFEVDEISEIRRGAIQFSGSFAAGEGIYDVMWHLQDGFGRFCATRWRVDARRSKKDRGIDLTLSPGEVAPSLVYLFREESLVPPDPVGKMLRVKLLVSMDVRGSHRISVPLWRYAPVLSILRVMARHPALAEFSVVAFSLDDQQVLFEQDHTKVIDFPGLGRTLEHLTPGTVAFNELGKNREQNFFVRLLEKALLGDNDSDAFIFVGWDLGIGKKVEKGILAELRPSQTPVFYLNPATPRSWRGLLGNAVKALGGTRYKVRHPRDLTDAIVRMLSEIPSRTSSGIRQKARSAVRLEPAISLAK